MALDHVVAMLNNGSPGVVVADGGRVVGVVDADVLIDAMLLRGRVRRSGEQDGGSDVTLFGRAEPVRPYVSIRCLTCGATNTFDVYLPGRDAECRNAHRLLPDLG
ncbi:hypothetical protein ACIPSA_44920 [Streptomyces sp. NPDC086549]|uniref:hypothetical protein n=1 Tax=Streptomyces sp. NPDC086549 TaxID=3365752 RepID=UPI003828618E